MNAQEIKAALNRSAEAFVCSVLPSGKRSGRNWLVGSLGGERGASLSICIDGVKCGVFCDFATGEKGDNLVELLARVKQIEFKEALRVCAEWLGHTVLRTAAPASQFQHRAPAVAALPPLTDAECDRGRKMAEKLRDDPKLCERIGNARQWRGETIRNLAREASLGVEDGKLAFLYDSGAKLRTRKESGERVIYWAFGKPWVWRGAFLSSAQTVYLCEGETDCISLIDAGVEIDLATVAVALPSASTFHDGWAALFRDKSVILALDSDEAGSAATARISQRLRPHARCLKQLNWEGVRHAC